MAGKQAKQLTVEEINEIRMSPDGIQKLAKRYGIGNTRMFAIKRAATLDEALKFATGIPKPETKPVTQYTPGGPIVGVEARKPAPVIFRLGEAQITIDPQKLYECYQLYLDINARTGIQDEFSSCLLDGVGFLWRLLVLQPKVKRGEVKVEVKYGSLRGYGEGETREPAGVSQ